MTNHETALEAAWEVAKPLGIRDERSHKDRFVAGLSAYISTLSPNVSGLVERLRKGIEYAACGYTDFRQTNEANVTMREAADALASLSLQLAAVRPLKLLDPGDDEAIEWITGNLMAIRRDSGEMHYSLGQVVRAYQAGSAAAQEENERLLKVLAMSVAVDTAKFCGKIVIVHPDMPAHYWDGERMHRMDSVFLHPSKEGSGNGR